MYKKTLDFNINPVSFVPKNKVTSTSNRVTGTDHEEELEIKLCPST